MIQHEQISKPIPDACPLRSALETGLAISGDKMAFRKIGSKLEFELSLSGHELRSLGIGLADALCSLSSPPKRIAIVTPSGPEFVVAILGCIYAGIECVAPPFPAPGPTKKRFGRIMTNCRPDCVLAREADIPSLRAELDSIGLADAQLLPIDLETFDKEPDTTLGRLPARESRILQYTSGTSGSARAVALTGSNIAANAKLVMRSWKLTRDDIILNWLPHHHDMGLFGCIIMPLTFGGPVNQMSSFTFLKRPSRWMEAVSLTRATLTGGPAFAMRLAMEASGSVEGLDLSCARGVFCGSEPIAPDLLERFAARFEPAGLSPDANFSCYGLAESTLYVAGRPGPGLTPANEICEDGVHEVRIVDPVTRTPVGPGDEGEIWVSGPSIASAYMNAPEESAATFGGRLNGDDGPERKWLRTGDLGRSNGGDLVVSGRIKDMIIANGANVPASEIEWTATGADPVFESMAAACFAHGALEERRAAVVLEIDKRAARNLDADQTRRTIRAAVRSAHSVDLSDITIVRRGVLPRTTSGKVQRSLVKEMFIQGELVEAVPGPVPGSVPGSVDATT